MKNDSSKVIITAALTGAVHTPTMSPYLPWKYQDLIDQGVAAFEAGAAMIHIHARNQEDGRPSAKLEDFLVIARGIKEKTGGEAIVVPTTGGSTNMTTAERLQVVTELKPELASFTTGTKNSNLSGLAAKPRQWLYDWEEPYLKGSKKNVFFNSFEVIEEYGKAFREADTLPEYELFDISMIRNLAMAIKAGHVDNRIKLQYVLGSSGGMAGDPESLALMLSESRRLLGNDFIWSLSCGGKNMMAMMAAAMAFDGHVRVGLEDSLYLEKGVLAKSNAEQVQKVARIAKEIGTQVATAAEARDMMGLKGSENVAF